MSAFEPITLTWDGAEYVIPANRVMMAIARIEGHITLAEMSTWADRSKVRVSALAAAYGDVLRFAGAKVADEDVYVGMFSNGMEGVMDAMQAMMIMMIPPSALEAKKTPGKKQPAPSVSSGKPSRRRSARGE